MKKILSLIMFLIMVFSVTVAETSDIALAKASAPAADWTPSVSKSGKKMLDKKVNELIGHIPSELKTNYQKTLFAYMRFTENLSYHMNEKNSSDAYGSIVIGWAQCDGMANGLAYILTKLNVPVKVVVSPSSRHVWNLVKMDDGKWYHIDPLSKGNILFAGDKTMLKYNGSRCKDYYVCDGTDGVTVPQNDYSGGTKLYNTSTSLHEKIKDDGLYIVDGWFYYSTSINFTQSEKKQYGKSAYETYLSLRRVRGNTDELLLDWSDFAKVSPVAYGFDVSDACGKNLYYFEDSDSYSSTPRNCYRYNADTKALTYEGKQTVQYTIGGLSKLNIYHYTHSIKELDTEIIYGNYRTKGRIVCADCGKMLYSGERIKPNEIPDSPKFILSGKKSKKITVSLTNKYHKETSYLEWYKSCGGYEIAYRKKGKKRWTYEEYFTSRKKVKKNIKVNFKGKYQVKVRYFITYGVDVNYYRINHYGPWSKIKTVKVKK